MQERRCIAQEPKVSPPIKPRKGFQLARKPGWEFLNFRINKSHKKIGRADTLVKEIRFQLNSKLNSEDFNDLMNYSDYKKIKFVQKPNTFTTKN